MGCKTNLTNNKKTLDNNEQYRMVENFVEKGSKLLVVGLNHQDDVAHFLKRFKISGIDTNEDLVNASKTNGVEARLQNVLDIDEENKYDLIWVSGSLLSLSDEDIIKALKNLRRALTPRGFIFLSHLYKFDDSTLPVIEGVNYIDEFKVKNFMTEASLNVREYKMQLVNDENGELKEKWLNLVFEKTK